MRRAIALFICAAFVLAVVAGSFVVATVAKALAELGAIGMGLIAIFLAIPVLVVLAWALCEADWLSCVTLLWGLLEPLGWS